MNPISAQRKEWNKQQKMLRQCIENSARHNEGLDLFLRQHEVLHKAAMVSNDRWSFPDAILSGMSEAEIRRIPKKDDHSVAWCFWHMARIEDVTMNVLVDGRSQILHQDKWQQRLKVATQDTGNDMGHGEIVELSTNIDLEALQDYRLEIGFRTREIVSTITSSILIQRVQATRLQHLVEQRAISAGSGLLDYWGKRTIAGMLLMPPTRHNFVHLNEAFRLKNRRG